MEGNILTEGVKAIGDFLGIEKSRSLREQVFGIDEAQDTSTEAKAQEQAPMAPVSDSTDWGSIQGNTEPSASSATIPTPEPPIAQEDDSTASGDIFYDTEEADIEEADIEEEDNYTASGEDYTWEDGDSYFDEDPDDWVTEEDIEEADTEEADVRALPEGVSITPEAARKTYYKELKGLENAQEVGLKGNLFMPFKSPEGRGSDEGNSEYEIGYGIKIRESWLSDNRGSWPKINGVPVDARKGITKRQAEDLMIQYQEKAYDSAKGIVGSPWEDMAETERLYWTDLVYNLGEAGTKKNPKALKLMNKGLTVEAAIATLDTIHADGKPYLGLFKRRIKMYNAMADTLPGVPRIEEYSFSKDIKVKFSSSFFSDKVRKSLAEGVHTSKGWMPVVSNPSHTGSAIVGEV